MGGPDKTDPGVRGRDMGREKMGGGGKATEENGKIHFGSLGELTKWDCFKRDWMENNEEEIGRVKIEVLV